MSVAKVNGYRSETRWSGRAKIGHANDAISLFPIIRIGHRALRRGKNVNGKIVYASVFREGTRALHRTFHGGQVAASCDAACLTTLAMTYQAVVTVSHPALFPAGVVGTHILSRQFNTQPFWQKNLAFGWSIAVICNSLPGQGSWFEGQFNQPGLFNGSHSPQRSLVCDPRGTYTMTYQMQFEPAKTVTMVVS